MGIYSLILFCTHLIKNNILAYLFLFSFYFSELPTCLQCVCLIGSVYCEEVSPDMTTVPPLPKETAYFYARFNKITKITNKDFADIGKKGC